MMEFCRRNRRPYIPPWRAERWAEAHDFNKLLEDDDGRLVSAKEVLSVDFSVLLPIDERAQIKIDFQLLL